MVPLLRPPLWLASTSPYRRALLSRLTTEFHVANPAVDEHPLANETASELVQRLALAKAQAIASTLSDGLVIGSDQVAVFNDAIIGKPHTYHNAVQQLSQFSGNRVRFLTGLAVINARSSQVQLCVEPFDVWFRELSAAEIENYISREQPLDCAGSFKSEGLGITLFSKLRGDDPNTLIGLPLLKLNQFLINEGVNLLLPG